MRARGRPSLVEAMLAPSCCINRCYGQLRSDAAGVARCGKASCASLGVVSVAILDSDVLNQLHQMGLCKSTVHNTTTQEDVARGMRSF